MRSSASYLSELEEKLEEEKQARKKLETELKRLTTWQQKMEVGNA